MFSKHHPAICSFTFPAACIRSTSSLFYPINRHCLCRTTGHEGEWIYVLLKNALLKVGVLRDWGLDHISVLISDSYCTMFCQFYASNCDAYIGLLNVCIVMVEIIYPCNILEELNLLKLFFPNMFWPFSLLSDCEWDLDRISVLVSEKCCSALVIVTPATIW